jgi:hypothetical protein
MRFSIFLLIISDTSKIIDQLIIIQFRLSPVISSQLKGLKQFK